MACAAHQPSTHADRAVNDSAPHAPCIKTGTVATLGGHPTPAPRQPWGWM